MTEMSENENWIVVKEINPKDFVLGLIICSNPKQYEFDKIFLLLIRLSLVSFEYTKYTRYVTSETGTLYDWETLVVSNGTPKVRQRKLHTFRSAEPWYQIVPNEIVPNEIVPK